MRAITLSRQRRVFSQSQTWTRSAYEDFTACYHRVPNRCANLRSCPSQVEELLKAAWQVYGLQLPSPAPVEASQTRHRHLHDLLDQAELQIHEKVSLFYYYCAPAAVEAVLDGEPTPASLSKRGCPWSQTSVSIPAESLGDLVRTNSKLRIAIMWTLLQAQ